MARILEGQPYVVNMIDDILVFGKDREEHDKRLVESKCCFGQDKVEFLGVIIDANGISPSTSKLEALRNLEPPTDVAGVRRFLGMVNHIGRFLPNLSQATAPISALLGEQNAWQWGPLQETAFNRVKAMLTSDLCVAKYHPGRNTIVSCDASSFGLGTALLPEQPSGERRAVAFASRSLTNAEQRYSQIEKEALAVAWAVHRFDQYVRGLNFTVETDHQPLVTLHGNPYLDTMPPRIQRFRIKLMRYQFNVVYVPGKQLATADTLSRAPDETPSISLVDVVEEFVDFQVAVIIDTKLVTADDVRRHQEQDGECSQLVKYCTQGWPPFAKHYGFRHITSSPNYPQSNGEVERMVRTVKELFEKADDPFLALLSYRDTAGVTRFSPAQLLMGRSLRTRIPKPADCLEPKWPAPDVVKCQDEEVRRRQKKDFDRRHAATVLPPLEPGDTVWVRDIKETACVLSPASKPRSYVVETPTAVLVRNRVHLALYSDPTTSHLNEPASRENSEGHEEQATVTDATASATPQVSNECGLRVTRFGRRVRTPKRLDL
ncbi:uncharacterized protein LOC119378078 [Rhipicephalus sanguineus]|uniref:uncharacterized protein LOC119378078 n=1 Tax=Rhipicephalus sanguineus TaxID=34632 RepID=UPI0018942BBC|nr:uncharacterized protein LOC119378078 [Rhipicephalus sanguineus]